MPPGTSAVLFINKTAESGKLSQSRGLEKSQIFSHVQRSCPGRVSGASSTSQPVALFQTPKDWSSDLVVRGSRTQRARQRSKRTMKQDVAIEQVQVALAPSQECSRTRGVSLPMDRFADPCGDPFKTLKVEVNSYTQHLLSFYSGYVVPRIFRIQTLATWSRHYTVSLAFEDPLMQQSLLSTVATALYVATNDTKHMLASMAFKSKALALLHGVVGSDKGKDVSATSCYAVALLIWIECLSGNMNDLRAHSSGLQQLVAQAGDMSTTHLCVSATVMACSYLCSAILDRPPVISPLLSFQKIALSERASAWWQIAVNPAFKGHGYRLLSSPNLELLGPRLANVAAEQQKMVLLGEFLMAESGPDCRDIQYLYAKETTIEHELLMLYFDSSVTLQQSIAALILFVFPMQPIVLVTRPSAAFSLNMAATLRRKLEQSDLSRYWAPCSGLLFWMFFLGTYFSNGEVDGPWFLSRAVDMMRFFGIRSKLDIQAILEGYYYYPEFLEGTLDVMWREYERCARVDGHVEEELLELSPFR